MALTTATKTLVDATATNPDSEANALSHGSWHKAAHAALKEVYGIRGYKALITQSGTSAPVATVLENTLVTTPVWGYFIPGVYTLTFGSGEIPVAKTIVVHPSVVLTGGALYDFVYSGITGDAMGFATILRSSGSYANGALTAVSVLIEVYP